MDEFEMSGLRLRSYFLGIELKMTHNDETIQVCKGSIQEAWYVENNPARTPTEIGLVLQRKQKKIRLILLTKERWLDA